MHEHQYDKSSIAQMQGRNDVCTTSEQYLVSGGVILALCIGMQ